MNGWKLSKLDGAETEILDGDRGKNYPSKQEMKAQGDCLFLSASNVTTSGFSFTKGEFISSERDELLGKGKLQREDCVLTTRGTVGNVAHFDKSVPFENLRINSGMVIIRPNRKFINPRFLAYFLRSDNFSGQVKGLTSGSAQPQLPIRDLRHVKIPIPPLSEQNEISAILGALDDKIELNRKTAATLEEMARALYRSWFVDFDPVHARSQGLPPAHMDHPTAALFPDSFGEDGLPEGWKVSKLGDLIERLKVGKLYDQKSVTPTGSVPVLDQGKAGIIGFHDNAPNILASHSSRVSVFANHTCMQRLMNIPFSTIQNVIPFRGKGLPTEWCHYASLGRQNFEEYRGHWPTFVEAEIVVPDVKIAVAFSEWVHDWLCMIASKENENQTLATLRDTLLPRLMSGELRVGEAREKI